MAGVEVCLRTGLEGLVHDRDEHQDAWLHVKEHQYAWLLFHATFSPLLPFHLLSRGVLKSFLDLFVQKIIQLVIHDQTFIPRRVILSLINASAALKTSRERVSRTLFRNPMRIPIDGANEMLEGIQGMNG
ncbi:hypothetical protein CRG98_033748 [Punica granatum]|uniref:Uncharacterized protein n=1 Tax=Punica granatum TaxID=22663 RepID=A0A2I0IQB8_PUNGR|nr:hypothetical protein CRG98_033748 [Punica granatum]